jgi:prophage DNA circulation protein
MGKWSGTKQQALKVLGSGADVPDMPDAYDKALESWNKEAEAFLAARDVLQGKVLALDNANSAMINAVQQFRAKLEKSNFKLDEKKEAKKIEQAQKLLLAAIDDGIKDLKTNDKTFDELTRHLSQLGKYKQSASF